MMTIAPLDSEAVSKLANEMMALVRAHYHRRPTARSSAQEVLNATAVVVATIVAAARDCGDSEGALAFFYLALVQQLEGDRHASSSKN